VPLRLLAQAQLAQNQSRPGIECLP
jgi:hypothetical protein